MIHEPKMVFIRSTVYTLAGILLPRHREIFNVSSVSYFTKKRDKKKPRSLSLLCDGLQCGSTCVELSEKHVEIDTRGTNISNSQELRERYSI